MILFYGVGPGLCVSILRLLLKSCYTSMLGLSILALPFQMQ